MFLFFNKLFEFCYFLFFGLLFQVKNSSDQMSFLLLQMDDIREFQT